MLRWFKPRAVPRDPYGISLQNGRLSVVGVTEANETLSVDTCFTVAVTPETLPAVLKEVAERFPVEDRRCVLSVDEKVMVVERQTIRLGNDMRSTLETETLRLPRFGTDSIRIGVAAGAAVRETEDGENYAIGFASTTKLEAAVAPFEEAGFTVEAVDFEGCAWRRVDPSVDAIIVERADDVLIVGFDGSMPYLRPVTVQGDGLMTGSRIATAIQELLHDHDIVFKSFAVLPRLGAAVGASNLADRLMNEKAMGGYSVAPLSVGGAIAPEWALAYGLATYSVAERLDGEVAHAF